MSHPADVAAGKQLRRSREKLRLTRAQLGQAVGITASQIERYENAENRMSASRMQQFADELGVHPAYFFETGRTSVFQLMQQALRFYADPAHYKAQSQCAGNASSVDFEAHGHRARIVLARHWGRYDP